MRRLLVAFATTMAGLSWSVLVSASTASADTGCRDVTEVRFVYGHAVTYTVRACDVTGSAATADQPAPESVVDSDIGIGACLAAAIMIGGDSDYCRGETEEPAVLTIGMVAAAFRRIPLPASTLQVQPPGGETLVNFETNFYTHRAAFTRHVNLLGRHVTLRIRPSSFGWHFGDDVSATTSTPGAPYPDLDVTHSYTAAEPVSPRVDTTYTADWRLPAGPWQSVPGTVTITGATVALDVREARPILVNHE